MKGMLLLKTVCQLILPFTMLYSVYLIANGDLSPGGGFQGGVVMATCYLMFYFIREEQGLLSKETLTLEKWVLFTVLLLGAIYLTSWQAVNSFTNEFSQLCASWFKILSLVLLNFAIGFKVTLGLWSIMLIFTEEGEI